MRLSYLHAMQQGRRLLEEAHGENRFSTVALADGLMEEEKGSADLSAQALLPYDDRERLEQDEYLYLPYHIVNVTALCFQACYRAREPRKTRTMVLAALVHDVGMAHVDILPFLRWPQWDQSPREAVRRHPDHGRICLRRWKDGCQSAEHIAYFHHRRKDGKGYPAGRVLPKEEKWVLLLGLFDSLEAGSHWRPYKGSFGNASIPLPWTFFDCEIESQREAYGKWATNVARRCIYGIVCDRIANGQFEPDLVTPFVKQYVPWFVSRYLWWKFGSRLQKGEVEETIEDVLVKFSMAALTRKFREHGAVKKLLEIWARSEAWRVLRERAGAPLDEKTVSELRAGDLAMPSEEWEDIFTKIGRWLTLEETCALALRLVHKLTAAEAAEVIASLFRMKKERREAVLLKNICSDDRVPYLSRIVTDAHKRRLASVPRDRGCTANMVNKWLASALRKIDEHGSAGAQP